MNDLFAPPGAPPVHHAPWLYGMYELDDLVELLQPSQGVAVIGGRAIQVPRLEAWYGTHTYRYGGQVREPLAWPDELVALARDVEVSAGVGRGSFDSCFVNLYRDGNDHISWHADDEDWIGPVIASVTWGVVRKFQMKRKDGTGRLWQYELGNGDLFVMKAGCQDDWLHRVPKSSGVRAPRLNLTFRSTVR